MTSTEAQEPPRAVYLTSHNTAIAPAVLSGENPYLKRIEVWFESVAVQIHPVLVELDRNAPGVGALQNCKTLSHLADVALDHKRVLTLLKRLDALCELVILYDFKSSVDPRAKSATCEGTWSKLLKQEGIAFRERTSNKKPRECAEDETCQFFSLDTKKNGQCLSMDIPLEDMHRKTYNAGGAPLLSPLFAVLNCNSDCLAHDAWQMQSPRDGLIRALHTTPTQKLSGQTTNFARVVLRVVTDPPTEVAFMAFANGKPSALILVDATGDVEFETASSFACVSLKRGSRWQSFRVFVDKATVVEEPIAASVFKGDAYKASRPEISQRVALVSFASEPLESVSPSLRLSRQLSSLLRRKSSVRL